MVPNGAVIATRVFVCLCWAGFVLPFWWSRKRTKEATERRAPASYMGIAIQGIAFAIIWFFQTDIFRGSALALPQAVAWGLCGVAVALATASFWIAVDAIRVLGKQWSVQARLIEGHRLVVEGPYSHVRHPIYTGMLGMLVATGISFSVWWALPAGVAVYAAGTAIRVRAEERLLREAFGEDFEAYREYVPAVIPRWKT
ncbi:MAG TPA: isoprenylcysteine carboxylmethyltransferase family protein [Candidatus Acidoferrales bacterium]|nr:isoprenylcysteine carboxylmethyltransferase family protein [Candidatus Acidoferrales bacterium]